MQEGQQAKFAKCSKNLEGRLFGFSFLVLYIHGRGGGGGGGMAILALHILSPPIEALSLRATASAAVP